jgi:hypothetical protein
MKLSNIRKSFVHIFGGNILRENFLLKNFPFIIALFLLMLVYIGYRYSLSEKVRDAGRFRTELRSVQVESLVISSELTRIGRREVVEQRVREAGLYLRVSDEPIFYIQRRGRRR